MKKIRKLQTPHINDSFFKQQHKIPPNQKKKNTKNQKNVSDNRRFYPNPVYKNENEWFCAETQCPRV